MSYLGSCPSSRVGALQNAYDMLRHAVDCGHPNIPGLLDSLHRKVQQAAVRLAYKLVGGGGAILRSTFGELQRRALPLVTRATTHGLVCKSRSFKHFLALIMRVIHRTARVSPGWLVQRLGTTGPHASTFTALMGFSASCAGKRGRPRLLMPIAARFRADPSRPMAVALCCARAVTWSRDTSIALRALLHAIGEVPEGRCSVDDELRVFAMAASLADARFSPIALGSAAAGRLRDLITKAAHRLCGGEVRVIRSPAAWAAAMAGLALFGLTPSIGQSSSLPSFVRALCSVMETGGLVPTSQAPKSGTRRLAAYVGALLILLRNDPKRTHLFNHVSRCVYFAPPLPSGQGRHEAIATIASRLGIEGYVCQESASAACLTEFMRALSPCDGSRLGEAARAALLERLRPILAPLWESPLHEDIRGRRRGLSDRAVEWARFALRKSLVEGIMDEAYDVMSWSPEDPIGWGAFFGEDANLSEPPDAHPSFQTQPLRHLFVARIFQGIEHAQAMNPNLPTMTPAQSEELRSVLDEAGDALR